MTPPKPGHPSNQSPGEGPFPSSGHHCFIYGEVAEARSVVLPFLEEGLRLHRRVLLIGTSAPNEAITRLAQEIRRNRPGPVQDGRIVLLNAADCFHRKWGFDRFRALSFVADQISQAREDGFEGVHLVQEGGSLQGETSDLREPSAYEAGLTVFLRGQPCTALCLYDRWNSAPNVLLRCLDLHPTELGEDLTEGANPYYRPEVELQDVRWEHVVEERLRFLKWLRARPSARKDHPGDPLIRRMLRRLELRGTSSEEVVEGAVEELARYLGAPIGRVYIADRDQDLLSPAGVWRVPDGSPWAEPVPGANRDPVARGQGLSGRAWVARRPVWSADLREEPDLIREVAPDVPQPRAAMALPLLSGGSVIGVLEFLFPEAREPDEWLLDELEPVARSLGETLGRIRAEDELAEARDGLSTLLEESADGIVTMNRKGLIRSWNWAAARLLGEEAEGIPVGRAFDDFLPPESRGRFRKALEMAGSQDDDEGLRTGTVELRSLRLGPHRTPVILCLTSWDTSGEGSFVLVLKDLSGARERDSQDRLIESVVSSAPREAMVVTTGNLRWGGPSIVYANPAFCRMTGYSEAEVRGRTFATFTGPDTDGAALEEVWRSLARGESVSTEFLAYRKDGDAFKMRLEMSPVRDSRGDVSHFIGVQTDVTEQKIVEEALKRVDQDPLTGLANRTLFNKMLRRAIERSAKTPELRFAVLFMDLDGFKAINDTYGHVLGDQLLVTVARALEGAVRPGDVLARFGGDEFVILVEFVAGLKDVLTVAERVRDRFQRPFRVEGRELRVGTSIGITLSEAGYSTPEAILRDADAAMYQAKEDGGGGYRIFDPALQKEAATAGRIRGELQRSLDNGEFSLHYQPLMDLSSSRIAGLELLLRWRHPERGIVPASDFIAQAQDMELMVPLGRWVIGEACRQLRAWQDRFPSEVPLVLSVNLSPRELLDPRLKEWFRRSLKETGADPGSLLVEIPESFFTRRSNQVKDILEPLRDVGVRIGIDGFGAGHSSIAHLYRFPVDLLKIDNRIVAELPEGEGPASEIRNGRAVRSILALGASLGMEVVAKGVETRRQKQLLKELDCRLAQGYLFSRPVGQAEAEALLEVGQIDNGEDVE